MKTTIEGVGVSICSYEENHLELEGRKPVTVADLFRSAGAEVVDEFQVSAFEQCAKDDDYFNYYITKIKQYREANGREYPRAYRVKLTLELEELPADEAKAFWEKRREPSEGADD